MNRLNGRIAVVTGAASGIGLATSRLFAAEGATVLMVDRSEEDVRRAAEELGYGLHSFAADITSNSDLAALHDHIAETYNRIDILFANAGVAAFSPLAEVSEETFDRIVGTNLRGTYFTVQTLLPVLRDGASVILTSSVAGYKGAPAFSVYSATKAAIRSLARTFTIDLQERRIRVNALAPGIIETPIGSHSGLSRQENDAFYARMVPLTPAGRNGKAEDIAHAALYLGSDDSTFVTGTEMTVDGGFAQI